MAHENLASRFRRVVGSKQRRRPVRAFFEPRITHLEDRCMLAAPVPIPASNQVVPLSSIFWNGEAQPLNPGGKQNIPAPDKVGAAKTITLTNSGTDTIYPFLRGGNFGEDPNSTSGKLYDPQDLTNHEFREYVGYSKPDGTKYLGLPKGASITIQVPLVLWDGNNLYIATDGTNLTSSVPNIFNYESNAKIAIAGAAPVSNSVWVQSSSNYPAGQSPLVMFYFAGGDPHTVPDDAPAQLTEITFRDPYLGQFITDAAQTFPLLNYDVSYVNNLVAPVSMEASDVPITYGDGQSKVTPPTYYGQQDFGWLATNLDTVTFQNAINNFVNNTGNAAIGTYFGPDKKGWPQYYSPGDGNTVIPSGANLFDDSPLTVNGGVVHPSSYDPNEWMLTSNGTGPIAARAGGVILTNARATQLPLTLAPEQRAAFVQTINTMLADKSNKVGLTISPSNTVLGQVLSYDAGDSILGISVTNKGSGYSKANPPKVSITGGGGQGAQAIAFVDDNGFITGIGTVKAGTGYTSPPTIRIMGGGGKGATATAAIGGGTVTVALNDGVNLPVNAPLSYVFTRPSKDYAITAITNLWYSWAQYYVQQYQNFVDEPISATLNKRAIPGSVDPTLQVTNEITLASDPIVPLAVGMTVKATGVPDGTTILKIVGRQIFLSQIPDDTTPLSQSFIFGKPTMLPYDPAYTTPYALTFGQPGSPDVNTANLFAGSVYQAMASQAVQLPDSDYLPFSMNLVSHVIKFWAKFPGYDRKWGPILVGEVRDIVKSILRGVYDFEAAPDQTKWYPNPSDGTGGQKFNVYNLDPYVWFVHHVLQMSAYGFSVDDDVSNPTATGPLLSADGTPNHFPNQLQIDFGGIGGLNNQNQWFPTTPWGTLQTTPTESVTAIISVVPSGEFKGYSMVTFQGPNALKLYNQINNPGTGQVGAYILAPGFIVPGTTLIHKGPISGTDPQIVLSQKAISTTNAIKVKVTAEPLTIPLVPLRNPSFSTKIRATPLKIKVAPKGANVAWKFARTAGIARNGSIFTNNNPAPDGTQVAFIQNTGSVRQTLSLMARRAYSVSFLVAQRRLDNGTVNAQTLQVRIGKKVIGNFQSTGTSDGRYVLFTSDVFTVPTGGKRNLTILGTNLAGGDNTALIDLVTLKG